MSDNTLYISALQHYSYCPRQFALIHLEQAWEDNRYTAEGNLLHERVDSGVAEQRRAVRFERGVMLLSETHQLTGKMDLLEIEQTEQGLVYRPVEYKRGKAKAEDWDRVQLCAQALCIEEMRDVTVTEGALWYWETRRREVVRFDDSLRTTTLAAIQAAHAILATGKTPPPTDQIKRCRACSLLDLCEPDTFRADRSAAYVKQLFDEVDGDEKTA